MIDEVERGRSQPAAPFYESFSRLNRGEPARFLHGPAARTLAFGWAELL
jgi:hypothetical protein